MAKEYTRGYSSNITFLIAVVIAVSFGYLGYWYGTVNPGGFSTLSSEDLGIDNLIKGGLPRDHPGSVYTDKQTNDQVYENSRINLSFHTPAGYLVKDGWSGDATDLTITASSFEHLSVINTKNEFPYDQFEIIESETIDQLNSWSLPNINTLSDFISTYSNEYTDPNGQKQTPNFTDPQPTVMGTAEGYKATAIGENATGNQVGEVYFLEHNGHFYQISFRDTKDIDKLKDKILSTINFDFN